MKYQPCKIHVCVYVDRYIIGKPKRKFQKESLSIFPLKFNKRFFWWNTHLEIPSLFFRTKRSDRSLYSKRGHRLNFTDRPSPRRHCLTLTRNERNLKPNFGEFSRSVAIWSARVTHVHFSTKKTRTVNKKGLDSVISNTNTHTHTNTYIFKLNTNNFYSLSNLSQISTIVCKEGTFRWKDNQSISRWLLGKKEDLCWSFVTFCG